jgi:hypothetical protein
VRMQSTPEVKEQLLKRSGSCKPPGQRKLQERTLTMK